MAAAHGRAILEAMHDPALVARAGQFHPWDAMAPAALSAIVARAPFQCSAETGCGGSTIVLSHVSRQHVAFALEGNEHTITGLRNVPDLQDTRVAFVEGMTRDTLPGYRFAAPLDLVLLDGPHAYPLPQLEFVYLFPHLRPGGWLVLDDIQIPSVYELYKFLQREPVATLEQVVVRTAFFRKTDVRETSPDNWTSQGINRRLIWRYSWRDRLRKIIKPAARG